ncbi:MAG: tetratricopeptide repeat protein [Steroidobacteraceae bacterium]
MDIAQLFEAARNGDRDAAWQLGDLYREALHGARFSPKQAFRWYAESALAGSPTGQNNVGAAYENGLGCQQSYAKARKWYALAAAQGLNVAMANLAFLYLHGYGTGVDKAAALAWFRRGAAAGCRKSKRMIEAVLREDGKK